VNIPLSKWIRRDRFQRGFATAVTVIALLSCVGHATGVSAEVEANERVAWLKAHAAELRTIDPDDDDYSDLEPFREAVNKSRIVMLGEQSHGDGATFRAKIRLIRFLHERCGFDILAFES
jgi:erythromycin esterase-like protein